MLRKARGSQDKPLFVSTDKQSSLMIMQCNRRLTCRTIYADLPTFPFLPEQYPPEIFNKIAFLSES